MRAASCRCGYRTCKLLEVCGGGGLLGRVAHASPGLCSVAPEQGANVGRVRQYFADQRAATLLLGKAVPAPNPDTRASTITLGRGGQHVHTFDPAAVSKVFRVVIQPTDPKKPVEATYTSAPGHEWRADAPLVDGLPVPVTDRQVFYLVRKSAAAGADDAAADGASADDAAATGASAGGPSAPCASTRATMTVSNPGSLRSRTFLYRVDLV